VQFLKEGFLQILGLDTTKWPIVVPTTCPQQGAGDDCALFADVDFIRGKLASAIIQEVNREKENKSIGEAAVEKIVSLSDEA
ncbi:hypothetical protein Taro_002615, partial [Colocasia esculenta]|nr:hypothetical protein [Colocasia esculenta]